MQPGPTLSRHASRIALIAVLAGLLAPGLADTAAARSWTSYAKEAREELRQRHYKQAEDLFFQSLAEAQRDGGPRGVRAETAYRNLEHLLELYRDSGRVEDFLRLANALIEPSERIQGKPNVELRTELGKLYTSENRPDEASEYLTTALRLLDADPNADPLAVLETVQGLARLSEQREQDQEAEAHYLRALELASENIPGTLDHAIALNDLAWFYVNRDRAQEALPLSEQAVDIIKDVSGKEIVKAGIIDTLGLTLIRLGDHERAVNYYRVGLGESPDAETERPIRLAVESAYRNMITALRATGQDLEADSLETRVNRAADRKNRLEAIMDREQEAVAGPMPEGQGDSSSAVSPEEDPNQVVDPELEARVTTVWDDEPAPNDDAKATDEDFAKPNDADEELEEIWKTRDEAVPQAGWDSIDDAWDTQIDEDQKQLP